MKTTDNQGNNMTGGQTGIYYKIQSGHFLQQIVNFDLKCYFKPYFVHF